MMDRIRESLSHRQLFDCKLKSSGGLGKLALKFGMDDYLHIEHIEQLIQLLSMPKMQSNYSSKRGMGHCLVRLQYLPILPILKGLTPPCLSLQTVGPWEAKDDCILSGPRIHAACFTPPYSYLQYRRFQYGCMYILIKSIFWIVKLFVYTLRSNYIYQVSFFVALNLYEIKSAPNEIFRED